MRGISWLAASRSAAQEGLCTMEWVSKYVMRVEVSSVDMYCDLTGLWNSVFWQTSSGVSRVSFEVKKDLQKKTFDLGNRSFKGGVFTWVTTNVDFFGNVTQCNDIDSKLFFSRNLSSGEIYRLDFWVSTHMKMWSGYLSRYSDWLRAGRSGIEFRLRRGFPTIQTVPGGPPSLM